MVQRDIDEVYRVYTNYTRRNKLPREIYFRFSKKSLREELYQSTRDQKITYQGQAIVILKQVPRRVRKQRQKYQFLTEQLRKYRVPYRWLFPEGLMMTSQDKRVKIENLRDAHDFYENQFNVSEPGSEEELEQKSCENQKSGRTEKGRKLKETTKGGKRDTSEDETPGT